MAFLLILTGLLDHYPSIDAGNPLSVFSDPGPSGNEGPIRLFTVQFPISACSFGLTDLVLRAVSVDDTLDNAIQGSLDIYLGTQPIV
jgi:hypothetical protein